MKYQVATKVMQKIAGVWGNRYVFTAESVNTWLLGCKTHNGWHHIYRFEMPMIEFRLQRITQSV